MGETTDLAEVPGRSTDLGELQTILSQLVGQPLLTARRSYGDELRIHLGAERTIPNPRPQWRAIGSFVVGTQASDWAVRSATGATLLACAGEREDCSEALGAIESGGYATAGVAIQAASAFAVEGGYGLSLRFADGVELLVTPPSPGPPEPADGDDPVADWEVLTSHDRLLSVGPGRSWSYLTQT